MKPQHFRMLLRRPDGERLVFRIAAMDRQSAILSTRELWPACRIVSAALEDEWSE